MELQGEENRDLWRRRGILKGWDVSLLGFFPVKEMGAQTPSPGGVDRDM